MANVTLSLEDSLIKKGRMHAQKRGKTLNGLIRELLAKEIEHRNADWLEHCFYLMDKANVSSNDGNWTREDLHER